MRTFQFEARHGPDSGNWGKFMVGIPDEEWAWTSGVHTRLPGAPLLGLIGWTLEHIWVFDLQTGEAAMIRPGGSAHADLEKHAVLVCPLFESWLEWLYRQDITRLAELPRVVDLPDAPFAFHGYRRPGLGRERAG